MGEFRKIFFGYGTIFGVGYVLLDVASRLRIGGATS